MVGLHVTVTLERVGPMVGVSVKPVGSSVGLKVVGFVVGYHVGGCVGGVGEPDGLKEPSITVGPIEGDKVYLVGDFVGDVDVGSFVGDLVRLVGELVGFQVFPKFVGPNDGEVVVFVGESVTITIGDCVGFAIEGDREGDLLGCSVRRVGLVDGDQVFPDTVGPTEGD